MRQFTYGDLSTPLERQAVTHMNNRVAILMGTYRGERFLPEQLQSIERQTHLNWTLWVSDDGSDDNTLSQLKEFQARWPATRILAGPRESFLRNFLGLLSNTDIDAEFYCFADQDDFWHPKKLETALTWLEKQPADIPALYCSRTHIVDDTGASMGKSPLFARPPSFSNALVQSIAGGNTMVLNRAARDLMIKAGSSTADVPSHDWWCYIVVTGAGGNVRYDATPLIDYRQHGGNLVGSNSGIRARIVRLQLMLKSRFRDWNEQHVIALRVIKTSFPPDSQELLAQFEQLRTRPLPLRLYILYKSGLHRQTLLGNVALIAAVALKQL